MIQVSLSQNVFRLIAGLIMLVAMTILANVLITTSDHARQQANNNLTVAQKVFNEVLNNRENLLYNAASVLTADFGFKQAVATEDRGTIESVLLNHGDRIAADLMALISFEKEVIASIPEVLPIMDAFPYPELITKAIENGGATALLLLDDRLYQMMMLTVDAPAPIAIALIGFRLDDALANQLKNITQLETTMQVLTENKETFLISTLTKDEQRDALSEQARDFSWFAFTPIKKFSFVSRRFILADQLGFQVVVTLSDDADSLFSEFSQLQLNIVIIAISAILLAMFVAAVFSRRLMQPMTVFAEVAQKISKGNYRQAIDTQSNTKELNHLSSAFIAMQEGIRQREEAIIYQARHDVLTKLNNRSYVKQLLTEQFKKGHSFQAIGINIFGFRGINDVFGYSNGDSCLRELARRLSTLGGLAARLTGGELLWVPIQILSLNEIEEIKKRLEKPVDTGDVLIKLKIVLGLLNCPRDAGSAEEMFRRMNVVLDEAKMAHQMVLTYQDKLEQRYLRRLAIITELKTALTVRPQELCLFYQPKLELSTGKILSIEALIRWHSDPLGFVPPDEFITVAEHAGLIEAVTDWVLCQAVADALILKQTEIVLTIAINLSAKDVINPQLLSKVTALLEKNGLSSSAFSFEITESDLVKDADKAIEHLTAFKEQGFTLAIDDFGTGYSSMVYLKHLPVTTLKVDKSFVMKLDTQQEDQDIVQMVIGLAQSFGLNVVAEGVENPHSLKLLRDWGCESAQGYYIAKPMPLEQLLRWLPENQKTDWLSDYGKSA